MTSSSIENIIEIVCVFFFVPVVYCLLTVCMDECSNTSTTLYIYISHMKVGPF